MKSSIAEPSRRNSGFEATANPPARQARRRIAATRRPVPTGTVDLVTTTASEVSAPPTPVPHTPSPPPRCASDRFLLNQGAVNQVPSRRAALDLHAVGDYRVLRNMRRSDCQSPNSPRFADAFRPGPTP